MRNRRCATVAVAVKRTHSVRASLPSPNNSHCIYLDIENVTLAPNLGSMVSSKAVRCNACGQPGHCRKTNKKCRLYQQKRPQVPRPAVTILIQPISAAEAFRRHDERCKAMLCGPKITAENHTPCENEGHQVVSGYPALNALFAACEEEREVWAAGGRAGPTFCIY